MLSFVRLTEQKMTEVGLISADFAGLPISFLKHLTVYLYQRTQAEFLGLYLADEPDRSEAAAKQAPTLCLRHAVWSRKRDEADFVQAASMHEYVSSQQHLHARLVFLTPEMVPEIVKLEEKRRR